MKKEFFNQKSTIIIFSIIILFIHQLIYQKIFPTSQGFMGHDFQQIMSYFIFGKFWFEKNFLLIPWFTPAICCGLPFYADPQSMFYSIPQLMFIIFDDAIMSTKLIFLFYSVVAYLGMFLVTKKIFNFDVRVAIFCSSEVQRSTGRKDAPQGTGRQKEGRDGGGWREERRRRKRKDGQ